MSRIPRLAARASRVLIAAGILALGYVAYVSIETAAFQADPVARVRAGDAIGMIEIPRLQIGVAVVEGDSDALLDRAVGHISDTALPGEIGNVVLAGHRDTFFEPLEHVRVGDTITVRTARGDFHYLVESTIVVSPDDVWVLAPIGGRTLTLITCFPFKYVGSAPERFIVRARLVS